MPPPDPGKPAPATLEYGRRPPLAWIGRYRWRLVLLAVCIAVAVPVYRNWRPLKQRVLWLYWSHRAATFQMPGGIELVVTDPEQAKKLLARNSDYIPGDVPGSAVYVPLAYRRLREIDGRLRISGIPNPQPLLNNATVFMGTLHRPDGAPRLIIIEGAVSHLPQLMTDANLFVLTEPRMFDPLPPPPRKRKEWAAGWNKKMSLPAELRWGTVDPTNPSHLIIGFVVGDVELPPPTMNIRSAKPQPLSITDHVHADHIAFLGTLDAYLQNDDSMTLSIRDEPKLKALLSRYSIEGDLFGLGGGAAAIRALFNDRSPGQHFFTIMGDPETRGMPRRSTGP